MNNSFVKDFRLLKNKKIVLISGGISSERKIAQKSSAAVEKALINLGLKYTRIDFNEKNRKDIFSLIRKANPDVAFLGLHGAYGEDGRIQGALDIIGVKYAGSKMLGSAVTMDKIVAKKLLLGENLPTPAFVEYAGKKIKFKLPAVVKPADGGSTVGVTIVKNSRAFEKAVKLALKYCPKVLIEKYIKGREVTVPVFFGRVLPVIEIIPKTSFYDFAAKYTKGMSVHIMPAKLEKKLYAEIQKLALLTHETLLLKDYSRIDFMIEEKSNKPYILEANSLPGLTGTSLLPEAARYAGISFEELVLKMLAGAVRNGQ
ncbi:MAG: D-alanine--D-alanine ligase [Candidatus Firestonebacteria bacterium]|nr:D-alanine--D-alanine ligase [Candidatus Firestonebacteria bacterium]